MEPFRPQETSISPRQLLAEGGAAAIANVLRGVGYAPAPETLSDVCEMLTSELPLLIEGPRGAGKTALPEALARACNLNLFYVQCMDSLGRSDILGEWDANGQTQYVNQALLAQCPLAKAQAETYSREFFLMGEALSAYASPGPKDRPNILIIDEIDKLDERAEDMFLGLLGRHFAHIPRLQPNSLVGLPPGQEMPVVVLTSNNMRTGVSSPLRSRCLYTFIPPPTPAQEVTILKTRVPGVANQLLGQYIKALHYIRRMPNISPANKPGLRESIVLLQALQRKGIKDFTEEVLRRHVGYLAKQESDRHTLLKNTAAVARAAVTAKFLEDTAILSGLTEFARQPPNARRQEFADVA